jgi:hypothetical protein
MEKLLEVIEADKLRAERTKNQGLNIFGGSQQYFWWREDVDRLLQLAAANNH